MKAYGLKRRPPVGRAGTLQTISWRRCAEGKGGQGLTACLKGQAPRANTVLSETQNDLPPFIGLRLTH